MLCERIDLYEYFGIEKPVGGAGYVDVYCHAVSKETDINRKRPAMLVLPGGGYSFVSDREAEPIALEYLHSGFNAFVLTYSIAPICYPVQLREAAMAMIFIRENAEKYHVITNQVSAVGFSAGGHLCGCLGTMFDDKAVADLRNASMIRPDAVVLAYPVSIYRNDALLCHVPSFKNVSGNDEAIMKYLSLEDRVEEKSSPAFIWHTADDDCVPCFGSLTLAQKYLEKKVPFELHVFRSGSHGLSVCSEETNMVNPEVREWIGLSLNFLKSIGFKIYN